MISIRRTLLTICCSSKNHLRAQPISAKLFFCSSASSKNEVQKKNRRTRGAAKKQQDEAASANSDNQFDAEDYFQRRCEMVNGLTHAGRTPYPPKFDVDLTIQQLKAQYETLAPDETLESVKLRIAGRISTARGYGQKLLFLDLIEDGVKVQVVLNQRIFGNEQRFKELIKDVRRGDIVGLTGYPGRTSNGELSLFATDLQMLSPCLRILPHPYYGLKDHEQRYRMRFLDLIVNFEQRKKFQLRADLVRFLRQFLDSRQFLEVETPMLHKICGGALAKPFSTYHNELNEHLYLRIAPELYLKMLVVGGFQRVYELGRQFRNEGVDQTHNPEFTMFEFYMAYADYEKMMQLLETMLKEAANRLLGKPFLTYTVNGSDVKIDFSKPFAKIDLLQELQLVLGIELPSPSSLNSAESICFLQDLCGKHGIQVNEPRSAARCIDKLVAFFIEPKLIQPTFLINHPEVMSPLAKPHRDHPGLTERFELYIAGAEIANGYSELNDPQLQRRRFEAQLEEQRSKTATNDKDHNEQWSVDETFCKALEFGLPPTGGVGVGVDRLAMLFTNSASIRDVTLFPAMRSKEQ